MKKIRLPLGPLIEQLLSLENTGCTDVLIYEDDNGYPCIMDEENDATISFAPLDEEDEADLLTIKKDVH